MWRRRPKSKAGSVVVVVGKWARTRTAWRLDRNLTSAVTSQAVISRTFAATSCVMSASAALTAATGIHRQTPLSTLCFATTSRTPAADVSTVGSCTAHVMKRNSTGELDSCQPVSRYRRQQDRGAAHFPAPATYPSVRTFSRVNVGEGSSVNLNTCTKDWPVNLAPRL